MTDQSNATPDKSPVEAAVEHAVEALVYAPIGLLFEGASLLPQLIEKGKSQVTMARMIGKFAVDQGRGEATKAASRLQDQAAGVLDFIGGSVTVPAPSAPPAPAPAPAPPAARRASKATSAAKASTGAARQAARKVAGVVATAVSDVTGLAIPDYDGLSASHVVNRLASLTPGELEAVRLYEAANRGRKTILSKVAQLQSS